MAIETLEDVNAQSCCCDLTPCPIPVEECQSVAASMSSVGFFNEEDEGWILYKTSGWTSTLSGSGTTLSSNPAYNEGADFVSQSRSASANSFVGNTIDPSHAGGVAGGASDCPYQEEVNTPVCTATGTASQSNYAVKFWGGPPANADYGETDSLTLSISSAEGLETEEHLAWEAIYTDHDTWQGLHDTWETDHAAWQADYDAYQAAYDAWLIAYDEWVTGGEIGDPPVEPDPFTDPEPEEPTEEPAETYPACWYKITQTRVIYPHWFGKYSDGTPADPDDPEAFADWVDGGMVGDPPSSGTAVTYSYTDDPLSILTTLLISGDGGITDEETYSDPVDYAAWVSATKAAAEAMLEFTDEACLEDECAAAYDVTAEPETTGADLSLSATTARTQFKIPATWADQITGATVPFTGTYFLITYDVLDEPDGWDDTIDDPEYVPPIPNDPPEPVPQVPKPGRPSRSFHLEDQVREWTGPGTGGSSDPSWIVGDWITLDPPSVPGSRRIVNRRFVCREDWPYGIIPQVSGEAVTLPDP